MSEEVIELDKVLLDTFELASICVDVIVVFVVIDIFDVVVVFELVLVVDIFIVLILGLVILIAIKEEEVVEVDIIETIEDVEAWEVNVSDIVIKLDKVA